MFGGRLLVQNSIKQSRGLIADQFSRQRNAGEGRSDQSVEQLIVVDPEDGQVIGNLDVVPACCVESTVGPVIVATHQPRGFGKIGEPLANLFGSLAGDVFVDGGAGSFDSLTERSEAKPAVFGITGPEKTEMGKTERERNSQQPSCRSARRRG